ncbi:SLC13 family permease [Myxococcota bacterium]|nr:SLC13 family permease [Myxococcota bacterium]
MTWEMLLVLGIVVAALVLFAWERFPAEQVALGIPAVLLATGVLDAEQATSGFSSEATVTVASMLVLSMGLSHAGVVEDLARLFGRLPVRRPQTRLVILCLVAAGVSPFLNNTAVVVVLLPLFLDQARRHALPASRYLIPLSYSTILAGTVTLVGTSTNILVAGMAHARGITELTMFTAAPLGIVVTGVGLLYLATVGQRLLPQREATVGLSGKYGVRDFLAELRVTAGSSAVGRTLPALGWGRDYDVTVLGIQRGERVMWQPDPDLPLEARDRLYAQGDTQDLLRLSRRFGLGVPGRPPDGAATIESAAARLVEVLIAPGSPLEGLTLHALRFQQRFRCTVLAVQHHGRSVQRRLGDIRFEVGDILLVHGSPEALTNLASTPGMVGVSEVPLRPHSPGRKLVAGGLLVGVVALSGLGITSIRVAAAVGAVLAIFTGCVRIKDVFAELDWGVVFLLAGSIPLGVALDETGASAWIAAQLADNLQGLSPVLVVAVFYLVTTLLTEIMSNNATAVVLTPIAIQTGAALELHPLALLVAVMFGASASFMTPVGYQTNAMVYGPGGYRFTDFLRVGAPLSAILLVLVSVLIPFFWPS